MPAGGENQPVGDWKIREVKVKWSVMPLGQCLAGVLRENFLGRRSKTWMGWRWQSENTREERKTSQIKEKGTKMLENQNAWKLIRVSGVQKEGGCKGGEGSWWQPVWAHGGHCREWCWQTWEAFGWDSNLKGTYYGNCSVESGYCEESCLFRPYKW